MDCREFRNNHVAFVDDLLPAVEMDAMHRHLSHCSSCSRQDTRVRRSLMLVRSLPPIEASPDFMHRLNERIAELGPVSRTDRVAPSWYHLPSVGAFAAFAAGVAAVAYMAIETTHYYAPLPATAPLVASAPDAASAARAQGGADFGAPELANAAIVASVPTGIPVWPAVSMAGQSPMHFASMQFSESDQAR